MYKKKFFLVSVILLLSLFPSLFSGCGANEEKDYEKAKKENTVAAYQSFLKKWSNGKYNQEITQILQRVEDKDWDDAQKQNTIQSYRRYLKEYPEGRFAKVARKKVHNIEYQIALKEDTVEAWEKFREDLGSDENEIRNKSFIKLKEARFREFINSSSVKKFEEYLIHASRPIDKQCMQVRAKLDEILYAQIKEKPTIELCKKYEDIICDQSLEYYHCDQVRTILFEQLMHSSSVKDLEYFVIRGRNEYKFHREKDRKDLKYKDKLKHQIWQVKGKLEELLYAQIKEKPTIELCENYLLLFKEYYHCGQVRTILEPLLFDWSVKTNTVKSYRKYLQEYNNGFRSNMIKELLEPVLFAMEQKENKIEGYEEYLKEYPKGKFAEKAYSLLDDLMYKKAYGEDWYSEYEKYIDKFPNGKHIKESKERLNWLKSQKAIVEIEYPKELEAKPGVPRWSWHTTFKETGGKIGYHIFGFGTIDSRTGKWAHHNGLQFGYINVPPGGVRTRYYDYSSSSHSLCNGITNFIWEGSDAGGHPIKLYENVRLKHTGCPGPK